MGLGEEADIAYDQQKERWMEATDKMKLTWDEESIEIYLDNGEDKGQTPLFYWHTDEIMEDSTVILPILNAVHLFYTDKYSLIKKSTYR